MQKFFFWVQETTCAVRVQIFVHNFDLMLFLFYTFLLVTVNLDSNPLITHTAACETHKSVYKAWTDSTECLVKLRKPGENLFLLIFPPTI